MLQNVTVSGVLAITGSVQNIVLEDSSIDTLYLNAREGITSILARGNTHVKVTSLGSGAALTEENLTSEAGIGFSNLIVATDEKIETAVDCNSISIKNKNANLIVSKGKIKLLKIEEHTDGAFVNLMDQAIVERLIINSKAEIAGKGAVNLAIINVNGVTLEYPPANHHQAEGVQIAIPRQKPASPINFKSSYNSTDENVYLSWERGDETSKRYYLFRSHDQDKKRLIKVLSSLEYIDKHNFIAASTYTYTLIVFNTRGIYSSPVTTSVNIPEPEPEPQPRPEPRPEPEPEPQPPEPEPEPEPQPPEPEPEPEPQPPEPEPEPEPQPPEPDPGSEPDPDPNPETEGS